MRSCAPRRLRRATQDRRSKRYVDAIQGERDHLRARSGRYRQSWLAVAMAVQACKSKQVQRIILTGLRSGAGERLGFLPGDLMAKIDPYLRPLFDALYDMVDAEGAASCWSARPSKSLRSPSCEGGP
ncbi:MAG: PhoH family protein [Ilumatobacteraceae bacterium]